MNIAAIKPALDRKDLRKKSFRTNDIIKLVQEVIRTDVDDTEVLARRFTPDRAGFRALFDFVDAHFRYKEDPAGIQWVQSPSYLWKTRVGDCKSYTVFISSVLQNIGVPHLIRYVAYGGRQYRHVYPVALLNGEEIPLDVVWKKQERGPFGKEKRYKKKKDFRVEAGLYKLGNTIGSPFQEEAIIGAMQDNLAEIQAAAASIPNTIDEGPGDVTEMTAGELDRFIRAGTYRAMADTTEHGGMKGQYLDAARAMEQGDIAGIGSLQNDPFGRQVEQFLAQSYKKNRPAFEPFVVRIPNPVPPQVTGLFSKVGDFIKKVSDTVKNAFKKLVNWVFKGAGMLMGPFFIFRFLKRNKVKSPRIKARLKAQDKSYRWIQRVGKFDDKQLQAVMMNGIIKHTGKTPGQIAAEGGAPAVGAVPLVPTILKAIGVVVNVIQKIVGIFKKNKNEAGVVDQSTMSDPTLFEEEARLHAAANTPAGGGGGGFNPLILAAGLIPILLK